MLVGVSVHECITYIHYKLSNFMHHLEYEYSGLNLDDMEKMVKEKKILYDHRLDKKNLNKWKTNTKLVKVSLKELPLYLQNNNEK